MTNSMQERFDEKFSVGYFSLRTPMEIRKQFKDFIQQEIDIAVAEREKEIVKELTEELDMSKMLEGFERYWQKHTSGRYIERCIECGNTDKILRVLSLITKEN